MVKKSIIKKAVKEYLDSNITPICKQMDCKKCRRYFHKNLAEVVWLVILEGDTGG